MASSGLRERKKRRTRETIQREALRLIKKQGYERTTIEQIAAAADISPSTFFNYFPSKEDVILTDEYDPIIVASFRARPPGESVAESFRAVMTAIGGAMDRDRELILTRINLMLEVPELRARIWDSLIESQNVLVQLISQRTGRDPDDLELRVEALMVIAAIFEAGLEWARRGGNTSFVEVCETAISLAEKGVRL